MRHERHKCETSDTSDTIATWVPRECHTNDASATRVKNFDFDNDTSEKKFSHIKLAIEQMKDYNEKNNFILQ